MPLYKPTGSYNDRIAIRLNSICTRLENEYDIKCRYGWRSSWYLITKEKDVTRVKSMRRELGIPNTVMIIGN